MEQSIRNEIPGTVKEIISDKVLRGRTVCELDARQAFAAADLFS